MTRKYTTKEMLTPPEVLCESMEPEPIYFSYGMAYVKLEGFLAWLYRGMIRMYGEDEAKERFYFLFHKKSDAVPQQNAAFAQTSM